MRHQTSMRHLVAQGVSRSQPFDTRRVLIKLPELKSCQEEESVQAHLVFNLLPRWIEQIWQEIILTYAKISKYEVELTS